MIPVIMLSCLCSSFFPGALYANWGFIGYVKTQSSVSDENSFEITEDAFLLSSNYFQSQSQAQRGLGFLYFYYGEFSQALVAWQNADYSSEELKVFGDKAVDRAALSEAENWYKITVDIDLEQSDSLANFYYWQRDYDLAIGIWDNALLMVRSSPNRLFWWRGLTNSYQATMQWDLAIQSVEEALTEFPNDPQLLTNKGVILYKTELAPSKALIFIKQAILVDENFANAYGAMADIYFSEKDYEQAFSYYEKAVSLDGNIKWWHVAQANSARFSGDEKLALDLYLKTVEQFPSYAPAYFEMAWAYHMLDDSPQAVVAIQRALELTQSPSMNYYIRAGLIYEQANLYQKALGAYLEAYEISPTDGRVKSGLRRLQDEQP